MKAKINLKNIKGYLQAHFRQALDDMDFLPQHIKEQAEWRIKQVAIHSPECLKNDSCVHCGCQVSSKVFEDRKCEGNCYPKMMSEETWNIYKTMQNAITNPFAPIIIKPENANIADLMQANPNLTKEELLHWCPEFKEDLPGKGVTKFIIKLSKDHF